MKLRYKNKSSSKITLIAAVAIVLVILVGGTVAAWRILTPSQESGSSIKEEGIDYGSASDEQVEAGKDIKEGFIDKAYGQGGAESNVVVTVTNKSVSNGLYQIRTQLSINTTEGTCTLKMTSAGKADITRTSAVQSIGSYSVCSSYFDIPVEQMGAAKWQATLTYQGANARGSVDFDAEVGV